ILNRPVNTGRNQRQTDGVYYCVSRRQIAAVRVGDLQFDGNCAAALMYLHLIVERHDAVADGERSGATRGVEVTVTAIAVSNAVGRIGRRQCSRGETRREVTPGLNGRILSRAIQGYHDAARRNQ